MKNRKKKSKVLVLVLLVLALSVGFAVLSTTLKINGFANISKGSWSIHWDNIANEDGVDAETPAYIKDQKKQIVEFEVLLAQPGDYYEFEVDAVNDGTLDGILKKVKSEVNGVDIDEDPTVLPSYFNYSLTYADGGLPSIGDELLVGEYQTYKVRVEYDREEVTNEIVNDMPAPEEYVFEIEIEYELDPYVKPDAPDNFDDDDWDTIAEEGNDAAKQEEVVDGKCGAYNLGDTKSVYIDTNNDGVDEEYEVRITNCSTPAICNTEGFSQTACGFVLEFTTLVETMEPNSWSVWGESIGDGNNGGWKYSRARAYLNGGIYGPVLSPYSGEPPAVQAENYTRKNSFYDKLPSDLRKQLATTYAVSSHGKYDGPNSYITEDKLYLLAMHELFSGPGSIAATPETIRDSAFYQTRQLDYYAAQGVGEATTYYNALIKHGNPSIDPSESAYNWLRSMDLSCNCWFNITSGGSYHSLSPDHYDYGVSPAFKLK